MTRLKKLNSIQDTLTACSNRCPVPSDRSCGIFHIARPGFFEDDMEEFHEYIKEQIRMRKARRNHKKRHQTRSKKQNSKKKAKVETAHPLVATPPGDEENHMEIDPA